MTPTKVNLTIIQGSDFDEVFRIGIDPPVYKTITAASQTAPLTLAVTGHGITQTEWPIAIANVLGMTKINAENSPPEFPDDYVMASALNANTLSISSINAAGYDAYLSGGTIQFATPLVLSGYTARMMIRKKVTSTDPLLTLTTENGGLILTSAESSVQIIITDTQTAALATAGVYDLEIVSGTGLVTRVLQGKITISKEVTR